MRALRQAINRLGLCNITTTHFDGTSFPKQAVQFDRIMVDVLCSCEGTSRKNPEVLERKINLRSRDIAKSQVALLTKSL